MKCINCICFGEDHISRVCLVGYAPSCPKSYRGIETLRNGRHGCLLHKKTIERCRAELMEERYYRDKVKWFNDDWGE